MTPRPSASFFSLPLAPWQQPQSTRVAKYEPRKRKRREDDDDDDLDTEDRETTDTASDPERNPVSSSSSPLILSPDEAHQYRIAGMPLDQERPGGHFPHAAAVPEVHPPRTTDATLREELSSLTPPIYLPRSVAQDGNLRFQHLAVLTTILHRGLLERDFVRAGRAWGLILREEFGGHPVDVRNGGRWGIGAEILLRRDLQMARQSHEPKAETRPWWTRKGFEDAKNYYERLILQYPYRKSAPDAVSSLHFYPAMLGLWIYVVQQESQATRDALERQDEESSEHSAEGEGEEEDRLSGWDQAQGRFAPMAKIRSKELEEAQQIAARLDELLVSPPYADDPELLRLRAMVSLWVGDLYVLSRSPAEDPEESMSIDDPATAESIIARREKKIVLEKREAEREKSRVLLEKAKRRSKGVAQTLEGLHLDDSRFAL
jgi:hypothetical protein